MEGAAVFDGQSPSMSVNEIVSVWLLALSTRVSVGALGALANAAIKCSSMLALREGLPAIFRNFTL